MGRGTQCPRKTRNLQVWGTAENIWIPRAIILRAAASLLESSLTGL